MSGALQRLFGRDSPDSPWNSDRIIREELFSIERLEGHAASLAEAQEVTAQPLRRLSLNARMNDNAAVLLGAYRAIAAAVNEGSSITPAAEWLIDNYHLVEAQIREIQVDLSPGYYAQLPKLASGHLAGYPRVFGIAWALIAHSDSRFESATLRRFVSAYQVVQPLTIGELWAIAITLRVVLVENLRRAAARIVDSRGAREAADRVADQLLAVPGVLADPGALRRHAQHEQDLPAAFIVQLVKRLRDQDPSVTPALAWLESRLAAQGLTADEIVHDEHQRQGAANVTVRNIITSMRLIGDVHWPEFFEEVSLVDAALRGAGDFAAMDFATRNLYRSAIEEFARGSDLTEPEVTRAVIALAGGSAPERVRERDPGHFLIGQGRPRLEREVGYRPPLRHWVKRRIVRLGPASYIGAVCLGTLAILALPLLAMDSAGLGATVLALLAAAGLVPAMDAAVSLVNRAVTGKVGATILPGLELRDGIPRELRTLVAVPVLLSSAAEVQLQLERMEVHYLASVDGEVQFALLSDWTDAAHESEAGDAELFLLAQAGVARLNRLHGPAPSGDRFHLLHRRRVWSDTERCWMGWERKRGKLHELNRLLRGAVDTTFVAGGLHGAGVPTEIRFVITLDADTRLPRETVRRLVGKLAHPLNRPGLGPDQRTIVAGYAILQPRVTPSLPVGREGSVFQRIFSSMTGIDPYDVAAADVYQDLFGAGSYAGKGIYDVDAFEAALAGRVPEGSLLSHDLFEGTFARAGLVSDIEVVEEFPSRYDVAAARNHRWARGDWQLLPWILGLRRGKAGELPLLGRWKMLDNLRRTLSAPASIASLVAGWCLLPQALPWTAFILATLALPALVPVLAAIVPRHRGIQAQSHLRALWHDLCLALVQIGLSIAFMAHQAWLMLDAMLRTLFRLGISRRHLLEWVTAAQAQLSSRLGPIGFYRRFGASVLLAVAIGIAVVVAGRNGWMAFPLVLAWCLAPAIAWRISMSPLVAGRLAVQPQDSLALRRIARRTWRYFETFVTAGDHWLPPDNLQEDPYPVVAHRTSPTNIGLYLLCTISARDFGWIGIATAVTRLNATFATLGQLQLYRGHFYNWYGTSDLRPLEPRYVSAVDSGNLAAHLVAVANACRDWIESPPDGSAFAAGSRDALYFVREALLALPRGRRLHAVTPAQLLDLFAVLERQLEAAALPEPDRMGGLLQAAANLADAARALAGEYDDEPHGDLVFWTEALLHGLEDWHAESLQTQATRTQLNERLATLGQTARRMAWAMEFGFLLDQERKLLVIGYRVDEGEADSSCYDLLASEARLASFFAIAKNDVPARHWFRLGREVTPIGPGIALVSWSGSMFEYLMPSLVMRAPAGSLLEQTNRLIVRRQIEYGNTLGTPWGVSESAYSARDLELTYQYSNFGVPGLGLKRGLSENLVIAPYATALAAMVDPDAAAQNFLRLAMLGARGRYGFYEALDYTRSRLPQDARLAIVRAYMAHHQGMTVVAIANVLFDGRMRARFHAEPSIRATELLLQEGTPRDLTVSHPRAEEVRTASRVGIEEFPEVRRLHTAHTPTPQTHLLSNGRYSVMVSAAGSGYSRWQGLALTRWRADATRDDTGTYLFMRDVRSGDVWSATQQPAGIDPDRYAVAFMEDRAEFERVDAGMVSRLQIIVSPEDDAEVRRLSLSNTGDEVRVIDVTSCCELVLAPPEADAAHPAFSKLFVQTEYVARPGVLLATRRKRSPDEPDVWMAHHAVVEGEVLGQPEFESDRARFLGRGREIDEPIAVFDGRPLSNTAGTVLDPVFVLRYRVRIPPGATVHLSFWTEVASSRAGVLDLFDKHHDVNAFGRAATLAWTQAQVQLRHLGVNAEEANLFQRIASHVLYADASLRSPAATIRQGSGSPAVLWAHGISGDVPLVLFRIEHVEDIAVLRQLLRAHEYWRLKKLAVDLVVLNERGSSYIQDLQLAIESAVRTSQSRPSLVGDREADGGRGTVFVLRTDLIAAAARDRLKSIARVVFAGQYGDLADQLDRRLELPRARFPASARWPLREIGLRAPGPDDLEFFNGLGGFSADGREYVIRLDPGQATPAPWINVIANERFGFQIAAEGGGYTWSQNSREHQLTQWSNDPVSDRPGEVLYVRDEESGAIWGPTAAPFREEREPHSVRHGQGYSRFEYSARGIDLELLVYVPVADPVKISRLTLRNTSTRRRRLSVTAYVEWVLGTQREVSAPHVVTAIDPGTGALFAHNAASIHFGSQVAFADLADQQAYWTGDRTEFLGRHGRLDRPQGLLVDGNLSGRTGAGLDPCCALQTVLELKPGESREIVVFLGEAASAEAARLLIAKYRAADLDAVLQAVHEQWEAVLGTIQVSTPDRPMDILLNRWLLYQTLVCRVWARSAFYQASGAYGFRDQLQDGMALVLTQPAIVREHLLRAAGRQFPEGDVQHWWLPPTGQGVRTRISDDRIWLALAAVRYLEVTGDASLLDEEVAFIEGPPLAAGAHDAYFLPAPSATTATFFEHCARGLDASLAVGEHGLPLIGTGDWNDGMNRVGEHGRGESVWLGWFLYRTLSCFAPVARARTDVARSTRWLEHAASLQASLERTAWDGAWYRRGYFDDGTAYGSSADDECRIDSIAQSWSVMSGAASPVRAHAAMAAVDAQLVRREDRLALLFTPPFDTTPRDPGYVKGYPPGLRENGGQYTHAAAWSVIAFTQLGQGEKAAELFALLNPINHSRTRAGLRRYRVEPYVVAADVYSVAPHAGRGGWTWYTGSAGWMYRAGLESILGFRKEGAFLVIAPCIPRVWPRFEIHYRYAASRYEIVVENPQAVSVGVVRTELDGVLLSDCEARIPLVDDGSVHRVRVILG